MSGQETFSSFYFLGIGGIGMSALARYFASHGKQVAGYDLTASPLTAALQQEGIGVTYTDDRQSLPDWISAAETLIVWTPAVPTDTQLYRYFRQAGYTIRKRAEVLGMVTRDKRALCVAGTHGKTSTSTMLAHILQQTPTGTNAFLGGVSLNANSNLITRPDSPWVVVEADEFDRSFHHLHPARTVITSIDPDHLDIYGTPQGYQEGFDQYARLVRDGIILRKGYHLNGVTCPVRTYSTGEEADYYTDRLRMEDGRLLFDFHACATPDRPAAVLRDMELGVPVRFNAENAAAALAIAWEEGVKEQQLREGLRTYSGVLRRFNVHLHTPRLIYIDDYAHHPTELHNAIQAARYLAPERHIIGVFQPHLFSRTRDFMDGFAQVLREVDKAVLLPIYPAREKPIAGITSEVLAQQIGQGALVKSKEQLCAYIGQCVQQTNAPVTVMTLGAGDIDRLVQPLKNHLQSCL